MGYTIHSDEERRAMLEAIGVKSVEDLFAPVPQALKIEKLNLPKGMSEVEAWQEIESLASKNRPATSHSFMGAGCYNHYVPAAVPALASRAEFATAYTPYQAEVSQGTLRHIFEFQTSICELTGLDVANASMYDGASALAEAAFMAARSTKRDTFLVSAGIHPEATQVLETYSKGPGLKIQRMPLDSETGRTAATVDSLPEGVAAVLVQQPNFLGVIEDLQELAAVAKQMGALLVVMQNPMTLGVLESPGAAGADIAVGDVQVFGNSLSFGGPAAGYLSCRKELMRQIPGRLVGQTHDADGRVSYTLTLQAREQHIRRAKATSNICSNQALCALAATIYLALLGPDGLNGIGNICTQRAHHLQKGLCELPGVHPAATGPFFYEFAVGLPCDAEQFVAAMRRLGIDAGVPLTRIPGAEQLGGAQTLLIAVTEMNVPSALANYIDGAREVLAEMRVPARAEAEGR